MVYQWVQKLAASSLTATSDPRVHAVADSDNSREWIIFRQASVTAGTGKLWRYASGSLTQLSGGPNTWTYYYAVNYSSTANQICVTSERKIATASPSGTPTWSESNIGGTDALHFNDKPVRRLDTSGWLMPCAPWRSSSAIILWITNLGNDIGAYSPSGQSFVVGQSAGTKLSSTLAIMMGIYNDGTFIISGIDNTCTPANHKFKFATQNYNSPLISGVSQILPAVPCITATKALFTANDGTDTSCISVNSSGTCTVMPFTAELIRPGIEANLTSQAENRIYMIRSDGRMYESNSTVTSFSLLSTSSVPQLSVGGNTALHMYLDYENKPSVIVSDGSVWQLTSANMARIGGVRHGGSF